MKFKKRKDLWVVKKGFKKAGTSNLVSDFGYNFDWWGKKERVYKVGESHSQKQKKGDSRRSNSSGN